MRYEMSPWRNVDELPMWGPLNQGWLPLTDQPNVVVGSQDISGYFEGPISTMQVIAYEVDHCMAGLIHMAKTFCPELQIIRNVFSNVGYSLFAEEGATTPSTWTLRHRQGRVRTEGWSTRFRSQAGRRGD
jgi:hypothetical protein